MLFNSNDEDYQSFDFWLSSRPHDILRASFKLENGLKAFTVFTNDGKWNGSVHADANTVF